MAEPVILFENVSKRYRLRRSRSVREMFFGLWGQAAHRLDGRAQRGERPSRSEGGHFWALREASFKVFPGETVGLIGANGAGKSTTLRLISGVSQPTAGRVQTRGRIGALLELGAGFHPELTGRDNVYLNAALLGMGRRETQRKFDAIVAFSELEAFLDTPVKHYSSGMFMRLAFAVNIHVDPEILLVDEVLAVGDQDFQRKCLDRIRELRQQGVNIFLVSHAQDVLQALCSRVIWLDHGHVIADGLPDVVIKQYLSHYAQREEERLVGSAASGPAQRWGNRLAEITRVCILDEQGAACAVFQTGQSLTISLEYRAHRRIPAPVFGLAIYRQDGFQISGPNTGWAGLAISDLVAAGRVQYIVPQLPLLDGLYYVSVSVHDRTGLTMYDYHDRLYPFRVVNLPDSPVREKYGLITLHGTWIHEAKGG